jgi:glutathionylspermidine synthase
MSLECAVSAQLPRNAFKAYRLDAIFAGHKWDAQLHDRSTVADRAIVLGAREWHELTAATEALFAETLQIERELQRAAAVAPPSYLPQRASRRLAQLAPLPSSGSRLMRFDFHPTREGWKLSEVNSDVPGGLNESTTFAELWPRRPAGWQETGRPGELYVDRLIASFGLRPGARVALIHATSYSDDWQHMAFLKQLLEARGIEAFGSAPTSIELDGGAMLVDGVPLDAALRFFPGDWLLFAREGEGWFSRHPQRLSNPLHALFSQNKFFPVVCAAADIGAPTWASYLPATAPLRVRDLLGSRHIAKPSFGRVGEDIAPIDTLPYPKRVGIAASLLLAKGLWIRQTPFESLNLGSATEPLHACVGVYCVDGKVAGCYGRLSPLRIVGMSAADAPVFVTH